MDNLINLVRMIIEALMVAMQKHTVKAAEKKEDLDIPEPLPLPDKPTEEPEPAPETQDSTEPEPPPEDPRRVFNEALELTLRYEGGYVNHPNDPGGATNKGVTQKVYDQYRKEKGLAQKTVKKIPDDEVEDIYYDKYWLKGRCDKLPENLAIVHFDTSVNSGIIQSSKFVQRAVGANDDGMIGPKTLEAVKSAVQSKGEMAIVKSFLDQRREFFKLIAERKPKLKVFLKGWMNRVASLEDYIGADRLMYASSQSDDEPSA